jgi:hypothetical protein
MRLLDVDTVREVLAAIPIAEPEPETGRLFELFELFDAALAKYDLAEAIARVRTRVYLSLARRELEHAPLEEVGGALSDLAAGCIDTAMHGGTHAPEQHGQRWRGPLLTRHPACETCSAAQPANASPHLPHFSWCALHRALPTTRLHRTQAATGATRVTSAPCAPAAGATPADSSRDRAL